MKLTQAFLASLLFFGVTPLAVDKRRDEHALTTTSGPFAASTIALVTPDEPGVVGIPDIAHDVLEARKSRGGGSHAPRPHPQPHHARPKPKPKPAGHVKPKPKGHGKPKPKCTAAMRKAGKCGTTQPKCTAAMKKAGKCGTKQPTCTAAEKKKHGGKCPAQVTCTRAEKKANGGKCPPPCTAAEKKQNGGKCPTCTAAEKKKNGGKCPNKKRWEVLNPSKGCRPAGKAIGGGGKKGGRKGARDVFSDSHSKAFSKRAAAAEPAAKTEAGLNAWTKDVWASSPQVLHMPANSFEPTSFFKSWAELGSGIKFVTVKSLMGCTSVVAVSDEGVYVSHHWQNTVSDAALRDLTPQFDNAFTNPLTGKRRASFHLTPAQTKIATEYEDIKSVKEAVDLVYPTSGFEALTSVKSHFTKNVQSMVAVWDGVTGSGDRYRTSGAHMKSFIDGLLPGSATKLVHYKNSEDALATSGSDSDYHGKVIVSYDSATKKYQVWMPAADLSGPILHN